MKENSSLEGYSEEEIVKLVDGHKEFVEQLSKDMSGKSTGEILSLDIAMIVSVCLTRMFLGNPASVMMKEDLMSLTTLVANSVLKYQEQKMKENSALEGIWGKD